jgi:uncharacterized RDD family membrane protein YckC
MVKDTVDELKEVLKIPEEHKVIYKQYGGFWRRALAAIVDAIIMGTAGFVPYVGWFVSVFYYPLLTAFYGQTVGKKLLGLMVVNREDKTPIGLYDALIREWVGKLVFAIANILLFLGSILLGFDSKKEGLHDKIAKTHVVRV